MIKALIIDDEQSAHDALTHYLPSGQVEISGNAYNVEEGLNAIKNLTPDLVFLDIDMPDGTGFDLLSKIGNPNFILIFVTAHNEHAQTAIRLGALDYLTKPVAPAELMSALLRVQLKQFERIQLKQLEIVQETLQLIKQKQLPQRIALPTTEGIFYLPTLDILRFEALQNYTQIHLLDGTTKIASTNLKSYEDDLKPYKEFKRIHRSHMVNLLEVVKCKKGDNSSTTLSNGEMFPVSKKYRSNFFDALDNL